MRTALLTLLLAPAALAGTTIEVWSRPGGTRADQAFDRGAVRTVDLQKLAAVDEERIDLQLGGKQHFHGVRLEALLQEGTRAPTDDLALLHFANGMVVPIAPDDQAGLKKMNVLVALGEFAPVARKDSQQRDRRPLTFTGNKVVVDGPFHPLVGATGSFSPWTHVDSLEGIEWVQAAAWWAQFLPPKASAEVKRGEAIFQKVCHFCHGLRNVGASLGWDFIKPMPVQEYRKKDTLFLHVRYREADAPEKGLLMPAIKEFNAKDAEAVLTWITAVSSAAPAVYAPR